jgi:hypothetical protein
MQPYTLKIIVIKVFILLSLCYVTNAQAVDFAIRLGQGGLRDDRVPDGKLGGGQVAVDITLGELPIMISLSSEYYKKSPEATYPYEINDMTVVYVLYTIPVPIERKSNIYLGGGVGVLEVPKDGGDSDSMERGIALDLAAGINTRVFWRLGIYVEGKYIYSNETAGETEVIDFSDFGALVGISYNSDW